MRSVDTNLDQVNALFKQLKDKGKPTASLMQKIAGHLEENIHENLQSEGNESPIPWAPLSSKYAKRKAKNPSLVQKILTATGAMDQSIFQKSSDIEAAAGTNKIQAALLNYGGVVQHVPRTGSVSFRTDAKGNLLKRRLSDAEDDSRYLFVFAKKSHKRKVDYVYTQSAYSVTYKPRPFLYLTRHYLELIVNDIEAELVR